MSDRIRTDSIDLIVTKDDFIELMDDNANQLAEIERLRAALERLTRAVDNDSGAEPSVSVLGRALVEAREALK